MLEVVMIVLLWIAGSAIALAVLAFVAGFIAYWVWAVAAAGWYIAHMLWTKGDG
jgi:hypothetical protein